LVAASRLEPKRPMHDVGLAASGMPSDRVLLTQKFLAIMPGARVRAAPNAGSLAAAFGDFTALGIREHDDVIR
jgi:hypothetical protein